MIALFSKEQLPEAYIEEIKQETHLKAEQTTAMNLHDMGMDAAMIAKAIGRSVDTVNGWLNAASIQPPFSAESFPKQGH